MTPKQGGKHLGKRFVGAVWETRRETQSDFAPDLRESRRETLGNTPLVQVGNQVPPYRGYRFPGPSGSEAGP